MIIGIALGIAIADFIGVVALFCVLATDFVTIFDELDEIKVELDSLRYK